MIFYQGGFMVKKLMGLVLLLIMVTGCGSTPVDLSNLGPKELVETYYKCAADGDLSTARACFAEDIRKANTMELEYIKGLTNLKVSEPGPSSPRGSYAESIKVYAEFDGEYKKGYEYLNGPRQVVVIVVRKDGNSPWKIFSFEKEIQIDFN
jgi:hypothetical protein